MRKTKQYYWPDGNKISDVEFSEILEIKKSLPKKTTYKNVISGYFKNEYETEYTKARPVNNVLDNIEESISRNPNYKVFIKQKGESDFMSVSPKAAEIALTRLNSEQWREAKKNKPENGTLIPVINIFEVINSRTNEGKSISIDFNSVDFKMY